MIHKYQLVSYGLTVLNLPKDSKVLCVHAQDNVPCVWVQMGVEGFVERRFKTHHTGEMPQPLSEYVGTFFLDNENYVGHVFEVK